MSHYTRGLAHSITQGGTSLNIDRTDPGSLLIGNNAGSFELNQLTAGTGVTITNGDGTITISAAGTYTLPIASSSVLGGIKVGSGLSIAGDGTLSTTPITSLDASVITSGILSNSQGGTGVDSSTAVDGQLLIGTGTGLTLANLTAGTNIAITNTSGGVKIDSTFTEVIYAPLVNGDLPGPVLMADALGQAIMVPI